MRSMHAFRIPRDTAKAAESRDAPADRLLSSPSFCLQLPNAVPRIPVALTFVDGPVIVYAPLFHLHVNPAVDDGFVERVDVWTGQLYGAATGDVADFEGGGKDKVLSSILVSNPPFFALGLVFPLYKYCFLFLSLAVQPPVRIVDSNPRYPPWLSRHHLATAWPPRRRAIV